MIKAYQQILVPIDGSKNAKLAFQRAVQIAQQNHAKLHLVNVIDTRAIQKVTSLDNSIVNRITEQTKQQLDKYQARAKRHGITVDYSIEYGSPKIIIANRVTQRWHVNLIIMGANGTTQNQQTLIGSVANYVTNAAPCNVLIIKK